MKYITCTRGDDLVYTAVDQDGNVVFQGSALREFAPVGYTIMGWVKRSGPFENPDVIIWAAHECVNEFQDLYCHKVSYEPKHGYFYDLSGVDKNDK